MYGTSKCDGYHRPLVEDLLITSPTTQDEKKLQPIPESPTKNETQTPSPTPPTPAMNDDIDWDGLGTWCQGFLKIPDSEVDSLWYERLAEAALTGPSPAPEAALRLYRLALEKDKPSWICHRGMAEAFFHFQINDREQASAEIELALAAAERDDAMPKPEAKDFVDLRMRLGQYSLANGNMEKSAELYLQCTESDDPEQAKKAQLGYFKARLNFPDQDGTREHLRGLLPSKGREGKMVDLLRLMALEESHDSLISKLFGVASQDTILLKDIVLAMEAASPTTEPNEDGAHSTLDDDELKEESIRGVLLYDRGLAAYAYKVVPDDAIEPVGEALRLWRESYDKLDKAGGPNAFRVKQDAKGALSRHYFQKMVEGNHLDHVDKLATLAGRSFGIFEIDEPTGYLGALYALRGEKEQAKKVLQKRVRQSLQFLSDDLSYNDGFAVSALSQALLQSQDFKGAAIAISLLGMADIIRQRLEFSDTAVEPEEGESKAQLQDSVAQYAQEIIRVMEEKVPDVTKQAERIQAAKEYSKSLMAISRAQSDATTEVPPNDKQVENKESREDQPKAGEQPVASSPSKHEDQQKEDDQPDGDGQPQEDVDRHPEAEAEPKEMAHARSLVYKRVQSSEANYREWQTACCKLKPDGTLCGKRLDFKAGGDFYSCVFCSSADFCGDCLPSILALEVGGVESMKCHAKHRWLRIPPYGDPMYVGLRSKTVRFPQAVEPSKEDSRILEMVWGQPEKAEVVATERWFELIAEEWDISMEEIKTELSKQKPDGSEPEGETGA